MKRENFIVTVLLASMATVFASASAQAQATINQNKALAGNVTPGDAPGFPVTISARGSYKLTGNLDVPAGISGILVTASEVTIDLNGFVISGPNTCTGTGLTLVCGTSPAKGIEAAVGVTDVGVHHGAIEGFGDSAVNLKERSDIDHVKARYNGSYAFVVGADSSIGNSVANSNGLSGVLIYGGIVFDVFAWGNRYNGIIIDATAKDALIRNNLVTYNGTYGLRANGAVKATFMDNQVNKNGTGNGIMGGILVPGNQCNGAAC